MRDALLPLHQQRLPLHCSVHPKHPSTSFQGAPQGRDNHQLHSSREVLCWTAYLQMLQSAGTLPDSHQLRVAWASPVADGCRSQLADLQLHVSRRCQTADSGQRRNRAWEPSVRCSGRQLCPAGCSRMVGRQLPLEQQQDSSTEGAVWLPWYHCSCMGQAMGEALHCNAPARTQFIPEGWCVNAEHSVERVCLVQGLPSCRAVLAGFTLRTAGTWSKVQASQMPMASAQC